MNIAGHDVGVCSWSLQPRDIGEMLRLVAETGLRHVQLALGPLVFLDDKRKFQQLGLLRDSGLTLTAGMIAFPGEDYSSITTIRKTGGYVPDDQWPARRQLSREAARLAQELELRAISTHVGFVPAPAEAGYEVIVSRVGEIARTFGDHGIGLPL